MPALMQDTQQSLHKHSEYEKRLGGEKISMKPPQINLSPLQRKLSSEAFQPDAFLEFSEKTELSLLSLLICPSFVQSVEPP